MNESVQKRWQSPVFWGAIIAQILSLLVLFDVIDLQLSEAISNAVCVVLELLVTFGILNNPTNGKAL